MKLIYYLTKNKRKFTIDEQGRIFINGALDLYGTGITELPDNLTVGRYLDLADTGITELPENLTVGGSIHLIGTSITKLPKNLTVGRHLSLCSSLITDLSENLTVGSFLDIRGTGITDLPDNLTVGGALYLAGAWITELPKHLTVGRSLDLCGTGITEIPETLTVGSLALDEKNITNIALKEGCGREKRTIFAAWVNGGVNISAGCFLGSLDDFFVAVDKSYSGEDAKQYKADAQYCSDKLINMRSLKQSSQTTMRSV